MTEIRLVLVERDPIFRLGLQTLIEEAGQSIIVSTYHNLEALEVTLETGCQEVDVMVIGDSDLGALELPEWLDTYQEMCGNNRIIVVSWRLTWSYIYRVLGSGVCGYIHRGEVWENLVTAIETVVKSETKVLSSSAINVMSLMPQDVNTKRLSAKHLDLLNLLADGYTLGKCAQEMGIPYQTAYKKRCDLKRFVGATNNDQLIDMARRQGLLGE